MPTKATRTLQKRHEFFHVSLGRFYALALLLLAGCGFKENPQLRERMVLVTKRYTLYREGWPDEWWVTLRDQNNFQWEMQLSDTLYFKPGRRYTVPLPR